MSEIGPRAFSRSMPRLEYRQARHQTQLFMDEARAVWLNKHRE